MNYFRHKKLCSNPQNDWQEVLEGKPDVHIFDKASLSDFTMTEFSIKEELYRETGAST